MEIHELLGRWGGVSKSRDLVRTAGQRENLGAAVKDGTILALGHGWFALADANPCVARARRLNAVITCVTAASFYGLAVLNPDASIHLGVPDQRGSRRRPSRPLTGTVLHRERHGGTAPDVPVPLAPPVEAMARVLRCMPAAEAIVMVDSALQKRLVTVEELAHVLIGPGSVEARESLARCDGRSRSVIETLARLALRADGFEVRVGVVIAGVGEVDLLVCECVVVECDGFAYHSGRREYREDRRRDRELVARGFVVLRFTWEEIISDPGRVAREVHRVLLRPGGGRQV